MCGEEFLHYPSRARGARRAHWTAASGKRDDDADPDAAQLPPVTGAGLSGERYAPGRRNDRRQARELQKRPSSRRSSVKPTKITRKGASRHT
jgi:hypothetical protein